MRVIAFLFICFIAIGSEACPNLTGYFKVPKSSSSKSSTVMKYAQSGCDELDVGFIQIENGKVKEEIFPAITYVNKRSPQFCKNTTCSFFDDQDKYLRLYYSGSIEFKNPLSDIICFYDYADYSVTPQGDLKIGYGIAADSDSDPCRKHQGYFEVQSRTSKP